MVSSKIMNLTVQESSHTPTVTSVFADKGSTQHYTLDWIWGEHKNTLCGVDTKENGKMGCNMAKDTFIIGSTATNTMVNGQMIKSMVTEYMRLPVTNMKVVCNCEGGI